MAETAQEGIWTTDPQGRTLFANQKMADLLGFGLPEIYARDNVELAGFGDRDELARRVRDRLHIGAETYEVSYTRPDGSHLLLRIAASPLLQDGCHLGSLAMVADVTAARRAENKLRYRAFHDPLTGLPNRAMLLERLQECLDADGGSTELPLAVLVADIDHFKLVNDSFGHACGDDLLIEVSRGWERLIAANDMVARLGGDEFVILCTGASEPEARQIASRLLDALVEPILLDGRHIAISASIGIALAPTSETSRDAATMLRYADAAMYEVKAHGRGRTGMFDSRLITEARHRLDLYNDLKEALQRDELTLSYQPVIELATGRLLGVEALCRWTHPRHGYVPPDTFIALAESTGLIEALDRWVLLRACLDAAELRAEGALALDAYVAVNVSAEHLAHTGFEAAVVSALTRAGLPAHALVLEVTESAVMRDPDAAQIALERLKEIGVEVAIDDFGTGYSSLAYLRRFPVATLKIDRGFVEHITDRGDDHAIVAAVVDLSHALRLSTTAEGIETFADLAMLRQLGCRAGQGFLWSPAVPRSELATMLAGLAEGRFPVAPDASPRSAASRSTVPVARYGQPESVAR